MNRIYCVYLLYAENEEAPFYVGKSFIGSVRLHQHYTDVKRLPSHKSSKILSTLNQGMSIVQKIVFTSLHEQEAFDKEKELIAFYGRKDNGTGILCNHTDGGEGCRGYIRTRKRVAYNKGIPLDSKTKEKMRLSSLSKIRIDVFDGHNTLKFTFDSVRQCHQELGISFNAINNSLRTGRPVTKGVYKHWRFVVSSSIILL